jgi:Tfp pilus assembly protein FimV
MAMLEAKHIALIGALSGGGRIGALGGGWYISPGGFDLYRVQPGDSLGALADRYLGDSDRAVEIWALQSGGWRASRNNDMTNLRSGDQLFMPQEAIDQAHALGDIAGPGGKGQAPTAASSGKTLDNGTDVLVPHGGGGGGFSPAPVVRPVTPATPATPVTPTPSSSGMSTAAKLALGAVGVVAAGGAVAYGVHAYKKHHRRSNPRRRRNPSSQKKHRRAELRQRIRGAQGMLRAAYEVGDERDVANRQADIRRLVRQLKGLD